MVRVKNRYLVCEVIYADCKRKVSTFSEYDLFRCVQSAINQAYGDYGLGILKTSLAIKHWNPVTNILLIRAKREAHHLVQTAITFIKKIVQEDAFFNTLHVGGTIRSCYKFLIRHHQRQLPALLKECETKAQRDRVKAAILSCNSAVKREAEGRDFNKEVLKRKTAT